MDLAPRHMLIEASNVMTGKRQHEEAASGGMHSIATNSLLRSPISNVVSQHLEDAAGLRVMRSVLVRAPHVGLPQLRRVDDRLCAHLDGLVIAGAEAMRMSRAGLDGVGGGYVFVLALLALGQRDDAELARVLALAGAVPEAARELVSAFGWAPGAWLSEVIVPMLNSDKLAQRWLGIAACAQHRVDPGKALDAAIEGDHPGLRAYALRVAGELGRTDLMPSCIGHLADENGACAEAAAVAGLRLGDRGTCAETLETHVMRLAPPALALALQGAQQKTVRRLLKRLVEADAPQRTLIRAAGWAGDPEALPWLLAQMAQDGQARLAGDAFRRITGADLAALGLDRNAPGDADFGPGEHPEDSSVALDEDEGLRWPDPAKAAAWWDVNKHRFQPGVRYFLGEPPTVPHCRRIVCEGFQHERIAAADYLCLLQPGARLFAISAPAWRQQRWLGQWSRA